ncbi:MAG: sulfatase [Planctomycetaceae bacterium]
MRTDIPLSIAAICAAAAAWTPFAGAAQRPNVLLVIADDMTYHDCGAYGSAVVQTPNIDRLAREGMRFDRMFTSTAMCAPTRQQLYTGVWPVRNGAYPNHSRVHDGTRSWAHHFRELGYRCGLAGKNHCKPAASYPWEKVGESASWGLDEIREFIHRDAEQPYFLVAAHKDPHSPWNHGDASQYPPDEIEVPPYLADTPPTRAALSHYYAEITFMDTALGELVSLVDDSGERNNTIVIFTSEQGSSFPFGGKWTCYENGLRTAFIVRWPARVLAGSKTDAMCQYVDVLPTLIAAAGADPQATDTGLAGGPDDGRGFDGISFLPVLLGEGQRHRAYTFGVHTSRGIVNGTDYPVRSVRGERFKYIRNLNHENVFTNLVTQNGQGDSEDNVFASWLAAGNLPTERAKAYQRRPAEELYDLDADPFEITNLAGLTALADVQQELRNELDRWMKQQGDQGLGTERLARERQEKSRSERRP